MKVNFMDNGNQTTDAQKLTGYNILNNMNKETDSNGNYLYTNNKADFFKDKTNLQLSEQNGYIKPTNLRKICGENSDYSPQVNM